MTLSIFNGVQVLILVKVAIIDVQIIMEKWLFTASILHVNYGNYKIESAIAQISLKGFWRYQI